jgi:hypothetical protein
VSGPAASEQARDLAALDADLREAGVAVPAGPSGAASGAPGGPPDVEEHLPSGDDRELGDRG